MDPKVLLNEFEIQQLIKELLEIEFKEPVCTLEHAGLSASAKGVVLNICGREFQIVVLRTK